ncbi:MAG: hypothetical protein BMS9Abin12_2171 [Acidimicrobiia bacterium]|nr:MAG: hypothetical protein BMS9Abin12_2171 [Acidimicrobiia bacterium]
MTAHMSRKRVIVTGGPGFMGNYVSVPLRQEGYDLCGRGNTPC